MGETMHERIDEAAFWRLYDEALPIVYGYLLRRSNLSVAEDLTQEVFTTAARTVATGGGATMSVPWLLSVARSRFVDHVRAEQRAEHKLQLAWSARPSRDDVVSVDDAFDAGRLQPATEAALASLAPMQRAALVLHHLDDLSVADVAKSLDKSVRATESLLARARRAFRDAFEEEARA